MTHTRKLLLFSDPHLMDSEDATANARFAKAIAHSQAQHGDAEHVILLGDLSDDGTLGGYEALKSACAAITAPTTFLMGNEDHRDRFSAVFPHVTRDQTGHFQCVLRFGNHTLICLDTLDPDATPKHSGYLCSNRLAWLNKVLAKNTGQFITVVMHHPPFSLGMPAMDRIGVRNGQDIMSRLQSAGVTLVLTGHVHRAITAVSEGLTCQTVNSTAFGIALSREGEDLTLDPAHVPSYGVLMLSDGQAMLHTQSVIA